MFSRKLIRPVAVAAAAIAIGGGTYGIVSATANNGAASVTTVPSAAPASTPMRTAFGGGGSNARSGPAAGGAVGTVASVSASGFTLSTPAGQNVTVTKAASGVKKGQSVLVLGTVDGTTIAATRIIVKSAAPSGTNVVPFQRGAPSTSKQVGRIPANYTQGSGTIVGGTAANKATTAALASYPGGVVDRVVKLSNGEYEVHNIGVNWPHHVFVNKNFKVVGAN
jgi:hypothetical protein